MKISIFPKFMALNSHLPISAFVSSLIKDGQTIVDYDLNADVALIWSVLWYGRMTRNKDIWDYYRAKNKPVIVMEVGALIRNETWKIGINGINNDAKFGDCMEHDSSRVKKLKLELKPWKKNGENIIVCGQHGVSQQWEGMPTVEDWMLNIVDNLKKYTDRKIMLRPHPRFRVCPNYKRKNVLITNPKQIRGTYDDFDFKEALENAWAVVNYSSNPATHSVMEGVPVFVDHSSLAYPVGNNIHDLSKIENPVRPDREKWLNNLSFVEYTIPEIEAGLPWARIKKYI